MNKKILSLAVIMALAISLPALAVYCTSCGTMADAADKFCRQCGGQLPSLENGISSNVPPQPATGYKTIAVPSSQPQAFQVTSHYLNIGGNRLYRNSYFWIAELAGSQARVWSREGPPYDSLIMGWVSLHELEKRTTLQPGTVIVCAEPPPPNPTKVIVVERMNFWRHWGPDPFYHRSSHRNRYFNWSGRPVRCR